MTPQKAVLIEGYMSTAQFGVPAWVGKCERTYPLPPFSTAVGMIHHLCGWKEYKDMHVSVSGYGYMNCQTSMRWKGGARSKTETEEFKKRFPVRVWDGEAYVGWVRILVNEWFISDLQLRIHAAPDSEEDVKTIFHCVSNPREYPSLGRHEDLLDIRNVEIVEIEREKEDSVLELDAYCTDLSFGGTAYNLHKDYKIVNGHRVFNDVKAVVLPRGAQVLAKKDSNGNPVFLC